jgi:hypothetical protein
MCFLRSTTLLALAFWGFGWPGDTSAESPGDMTEPAAVQVFPDHRSESDWMVQQFWPMHTAYGWEISDLPDGVYKIVMRYAPSRGKQSRPISANDATREFTSKGDGLVIDRSDDKGSSRTGLLAFQLIDFSDLGIDDSKPARLHVSFLVRDRNSAVSTRLSASIFGPSSSSSPTSKPRWKDGELHFTGFTSWDNETGIGIRYDVFLLRSDLPAH